MSFFGGLPGFVRWAARISAEAGRNVPPAQLQSTLILSIRASVEIVTRQQ
jgi:hypothetical protein